jgi:hypothetical protein
VRATETSRWKVRRELEDVAAPTLYTPRKQRKGDLGAAVQVLTKCDEKCTLKATGSIKVKGLGKLSLRKDVVKAKAKKKTTLRLALTAASARKLRSSDARKGTATVTFKAIDKKGNSVRQRVKVKLR